jgi:Mn-containing catalase
VDNLIVARWGHRHTLLIVYHKKQYGGPHGELGASLRYISQRYVMPYPELKAILTDIGVSVSLLLIYL